MDKAKIEIKLFHLFNVITWSVAFLLFSITQRAKPQDIDMFNYGIETQISRRWNTGLVQQGKWVLLILCICCTISFLTNVVMSIDTEKKFSISQAIITLVTLLFTVYYFINFGF